MTNLQLENDVCNSPPEYSDEAKKEFTLAISEIDPDGYTFNLEK